MNPSLEQLCEQFGRLVGPPARASRAPEAAAAAPALPAVASGEGRAPGPIQRTDHAAKGYDLDVAVAPLQVVMAAEILDRSGFGLDAVTGVDWLAQGQMEVVYDYFHPVAPLRVVVRTRVPRERPEVPTITGIFPGANWHERETHDFFGLVFAGHPDLKPLLLPEDATFHPLRKDYQP